MSGAEGRFPRRLLTLDGTVCKVEKVWYETHREVFRVTFRRADNRVQGCQARIGDGRFDEVSGEELTEELRQTQERLGRAWASLLKDTEL